MSNTNVFRRLIELLPATPVFTGTVLVAHADGTATVEYPGGAQSRLRNPFAVGAGGHCYTQGDTITGPAPTLPLVLIEIGN